MKRALKIVGILIFTLVAVWAYVGWLLIYDPGCSCPVVLGAKFGTAIGNLVNNLSDKNYDCSGLGCAPQSYLIPLDLITLLLLVIVARVIVKRKKKINIT